MNRKVLFIGLALVVPLLIFLAISFNYDPRYIESPLVGKEAPNFTLQSLDGEVVDLSALRGSPVVINFWATWCQPCIYEHPYLIELAKRYEGRAHFLGVIYQDEVANIERFLAQRGDWGKTLVDPAAEAAIAFGVYGAPETFVVDPDGMIVRKITSVIDPRSLSQLLNSML